MYRQGDILLVPLGKRIPEQALPVDGNVVALGEATGHSHVIEGDGQVLKAWGEVLVVAGTQTTLTHQEHTDITIPEGTYRVIRQREFTPGGSRNVAD